MKLIKKISAIMLVFIFILSVAPTKTMAATTKFITAREDADKPSKLKTGKNTVNLKVVEDGYGYLSGWVKFTVPNDGKYKFELNNLRTSKLSSAKCAAGCMVEFLNDDRFPASGITSKGDAMDYNAYSEWHKINIGTDNIKTYYEEYAKKKQDSQKYTATVKLKKNEEIYIKITPYISSDESAKFLKPGVSLRVSCSISKVK